jgi:signal transduction histidine kinase
MAGTGRLRWTDAPLPLLLLAFGMAGTAPAARNQHTTVPPVGYGLVAVAALAFVLWRIRPLWSLGIAAGATLLYLLLAYPYGPIMFSLALAAFGAALRVPPRRAVIATGTVLVAAAAVLSVGALAGHRQWGQLLVVLPWVVVPAAIGVAVKTRRDATTEVRAERSTRAVSEERLRLAQEVHDVAGHGFAVIAMQAGVALRVLDRDPEATRAALEAIRAASRDALAGLRAEVEALQRGAAPRRPRVGLADLPALVDRMRGGGLPATLDAAASTVDIPPAVELAAYRIAQEALTNVLRHAGPRATVAVRTRITGDELVLEVRDTGRGGPVGPGQGIDGMRARAVSVGGTLTADPGADGGFAVTAVLPLSPVDGGR